MSTTPAQGAPTQVRDPESRLRGVLLDSQVILFVVWIAIIAFFTSRDPVFFTAPVFTNILADWAPIALLAVGQLFVVISGGIDLSVGAAAGFTGVASGFVMQKLTTDGWDPYVILVIGLICCAVFGIGVGLVNSMLIHVNKLVPFIATLVTMGVCYGLSKVLTGGAPVMGGPQLEALTLTNAWIGPFSKPVLVVIAVLIGLWMTLHLCRFGRHSFAIGSNEFAARAAGINVRRHLTKVYALSGMMAGLAGYFFYLRLGSAGPTTGQGMELSAIAAVVIGGAALTGGVGRVIGTVLGALIIATVSSGLIIANVEPTWNQVVVGVLIAIAATVQVFGSSKRSKS